MKKYLYKISLYIRVFTKVVLNLTEPFQHCNRHIYFDNFFTSVNLMEELLRRGTYSCGTLRANRYPDSYKDKKEEGCRGLKSRQERLASCKKVQCLLPCGSTRDKLLSSPPTATQMSMSLSRGVLRQLPT